MEPVVSSSPPPQSDFLRTVGLVLLALGVAVVGWVLFNAYVLWTEPNEIGLLRKLAPSGDMFAAFSNAKQGEVKVSTKALEYGNLTLVIAILWIGAGIGKSLVLSGARLLGIRVTPNR